MAMTRDVYDLLSATPRTLPALAMAGGKVRVCYERINVNSDAAGSYGIGHQIPAGAIVLGGFLAASVSMGSSTLAIGISGSTGKYRAAATFTATDTPTWFGVATALGIPLTAPEDILLTVAAAALPASGVLTIGLVYVTNN